MDNENFSAEEGSVIKTAASQRIRLMKKLYHSAILCSIISFLIPFGIMLYTFSDFGIHPFGNRQMLVVDLWHQYFPFFRILREKLADGGSLLYSWKNGIGTNFLSLISYYEASPLNLLSVFFSDEGARDAQMFILCAKIGFGGAFFSMFLRYTYGRKDLSVCGFSVMYALSSYTLGYYWNVMWFDTIALFPLVMLGITAICREGKWKLFTIALAVSLVSNYYIAYFTCVFSVFMFIWTGIIECKGIKDWFGKLFLIIRSSVLGAGLGAFMLLPAFFGLQQTYSVNNTMPKTVTFYEKWTDIFANMLSYSPPAKVEGLPNFACGMLALMLFGVFILAFGIKIREKLAVLFMLALITVSCNINILNFIFHGFHFTNQIPYRFAFIFSFVLASAAFRAYDIIMKKGVKIVYLLFMTFCPIAVFFLNVFNNEEFTFEGAFESSVIITGAFLLVFAASKLFPFKTQASRNVVMSLALSLTLISEFLGNANIGVKTVDTTSYTEYPTKNAPVQTILADVRQQDQSPFYRTEMTASYTLNDGALYGYYGLSQFSSSANVSVTKFMSRMGLYASEAGNRYYYRLSTPVVNSLMGLKYFISKSGALNTEEFALRHRNVVDGVHLYENAYPLSLGFMTEYGILEMKDQASSNPFEYQNELMVRASGTGEPIFVPQAPEKVQVSDMALNKNGYGSYTFKLNGEDNDAEAIFIYRGVENAYLYGYASSVGGCCDSMDISCGNVSIDSGKLIENYPLVFPMGNAQDGETSVISVGTKENVATGNFRTLAYAMKTEAFEKAYDALADEQLVISKFSDTDIQGSIDAKKDGIMFLSIPYERGWSVYIDGEKTDTLPVAQAMLGVEVLQGHHDVRLRYVPEGLPLGAMISVICLLFFILLAVSGRKREMEEAGTAEEVTDDIREFRLEPENEGDEFMQSSFADAEETAVLVYESGDDENEES